jgi:hypothetical protein
MKVALDDRKKPGGFESLFKGQGSCGSRLAYKSMATHAHNNPSRQGTRTPS